MAVTGGTYLPDSNVLCYKNSMRTSRYLVLSINLLAILFLSGCVTEKTDGTNTVFSYELWVPIVTFLAGVVAFPLSQLIPVRFRKYRIGLPILGVVACILFAPTLYLERINLSPSGFAVHTGFWGLTSVHEVQFEQLSKIKVIKEQYLDNKGNPRFHIYLLCEEKNGDSQKVPFNTTVAQEAIGTVLKTATSAGILVVDETQ